MTRRLLCGLALTACFMHRQPAFGAPLTPGNFLTVQRNFGVITEYTPGGYMVQSIHVPNPYGQPYNDLRDIEVDQLGKVRIFNNAGGTALTTWNPAGNAFGHFKSAGWQGPASFYGGGIADYDHYVFTTSENLAFNKGGIVRFDASNGTSTTFRQASYTTGATVSYTDLSIGGDGLLYALHDEIPLEFGADIYVFDPKTMTQLRVINLRSRYANETKGFVVDRNGDIYTTGFGLSHYLADGTLVKEVDAGIGYLGDIDISADGQIIFGGSDGVGFADRDLNSVRRTSILGDFVAFTTPRAPAVPEPSSAALLLTGLPFCFARSTKRKRPASPR